MQRSLRRVEKCLSKDAGRLGVWGCERGWERRKDGEQVER